MSVRIVTDIDNNVVGCLVAAAFTGDLRLFGTEPERLKHVEDTKSKMTVQFEGPPISEFVAIETRQDFECNTCELGMPRCWKKAAGGFSHLCPNGMKERVVPITKHDEHILKIEPTEDEIKAARDLPFREMLGVMSFPASHCKFEMKRAISVLGSRRGGWSVKHFGVVLKVFECGARACEIGLMHSKDLDPRGGNTLCAHADASLGVPRSCGCRIVMMNGAAVSPRAKKHTSTGPSTCESESGMTELFYCSTDVTGLRNLMAELGMHQEQPTWVCEDNKSMIKIANNRGSLGVSPRTMDLQALTVRNRIEDHVMQTKARKTDLQVADVGTKSLPEGQFVLHRDVMSGCALVKAACPKKAVSPLIFQGDATCVTAALSVMRTVAKGMEGCLSADQL
jgi:hypothetical protein